MLRRTYLGEQQAGYTDLLQALEVLAPLETSETAQGVELMGYEVERLLSAVTPAVLLDESGEAQVHEAFVAEEAIQVDE